MALASPAVLRNKQIEEEVHDAQIKSIGNRLLDMFLFWCQVSVNAVYFPQHPTAPRVPSAIIECIATPICTLYASDREEQIKLVVVPRIAEKVAPRAKESDEFLFVGDSGSWIFWRLPRPRAALT